MFLKVLDFKNSTLNFYLEFDFVEELHLFSDMLKRVEWGVQVLLEILNEA